VHVLIIRSLFIKHQTYTILTGFQCSSCSRIRVKFEAPGARKIYEALLSLFIASERDLGTKSLSFTHDTVIHLRKCTLQRGLIVQENLLKVKCSNVIGCLFTQETLLRVMQLSIYLCPDCWPTSYRFWSTILCTISIHFIASSMMHCTRGSIFLALKLSFMLEVISRLFSHLPYSLSCSNVAFSPSPPLHEHLKNTHPPTASSLQRHD